MSGKYYPGKKNIMESCELCGRTDLKLTFHHLIPRKMHSKKYVIKHHPEKDFTTYGIMVCIPCHKMIHKKISHRDLALTYFSKELLLEHDEIKKFVEFQSRQRKFKK